MAFTKVSGTGSLDSYYPKKAAERKEGDEVIGFYRDKRTVKRPDGTDSVLYVLETDDKKMVGVNASSTITTAMEQIPLGSKVKIVYKGKQTGKSGRQYNNFEVFIDEDESEEPEDKKPAKEPF